MQYEILNLNDQNQLKTVDSISKTCAEIVCGEFNDQITVLINGNRGTGKSNAILEIGVRTSQEIAKIKGGEPKDYFTLDNVAIITLDRVLDLLDNLKQFNIYALDDIGVGYSSREWQSDKNIRMNKIIQTFRTDNVVTLLSVPSKDLIDKVPRGMVDRYIETSKKNNYYKYGINLVKVFEIERLLRTKDKQLEILPVVEEMDGSHQYAKYVIRRAPAFITEPYEILRKKIAQDLRIEESKAIRNGELEEIENDIPKEPRMKKKDIILSHRLEWQQNHKDKISWNEYIREKGLNPDYAANVLSRHGKEKGLK
jgi:hypothetical protein